MTAHFAYGSNMSRSLMRRFAPDARPLGIAELHGHRFIITSDGYASVAPDRTATVHGVLWRITPRDRIRLDGWENVAAGFYRCQYLPVRLGGRHVSALVYVGRHGGAGAARPGYMELVCAAAQEWGLPAGYCRSLERFVPAHRRARAQPFKGPAVMFGETG